MCRQNKVKTFTLLLPSTSLRTAWRWFVCVPFRKARRYLTPTARWLIGSSCTCTASLSRIRATATTLQTSPWPTFTMWQHKVIVDFFLVPHEERFRDISVTSFSFDSLQRKFYRGTVKKKNVVMSHPLTREGWIFKQYMISAIVHSIFFFYSFKS